MKKFLVTLAAVGLAGGVAVPALAHDDHYDNPCGGGEPHETTTGSDDSLYGVPPSGNGETGLAGSNGYIEARGNADAAEGAIHGTTAGQEFYGNVGNDEGGNKVCAGSSEAGDDPIIDESL